MPKSAQRGFTVIELVITVSLIGLLAAIAVPKFRDVLGGSSLNAAASVVATDVETAFTAAQRTRRPVVLSCECSALRYSVRDQAGDTLRVTRVLDGSSGFAVRTMAVTVDLSGVPIVIGPNGLATTGFRITLTDSRGSQRRVAVSRTGQVRITS